MHKISGNGIHLQHHFYHITCIICIFNQLYILQESFKNVSVPGMQIPQLFQKIRQKCTQVVEKI